MTFLEPVIASIIGSAVTALAVFLKTNITAKNFLKYGHLVQKAYSLSRWRKIGCLLWLLTKSASWSPLLLNWPRLLRSPAKSAVLSADKIIFIWE